MYHEKWRVSRFNGFAGMYGQLEQRKTMPVLSFCGIDIVQFPDLDPVDF